MVQAQLYVHEPVQSKSTQDFKNKRSSPVCLHSRLPMACAPNCPSEPCLDDMRSLAYGFNRPDLRSTAAALVGREKGLIGVEGGEKGLLIPPASCTIKVHQARTESASELPVNLFHRHSPQTAGDFVAWTLVRILRVASDVHFGTRYIHRALLIETVSGRSSE
jgi:hypothetical protein